MNVLVTGIGGNIGIDISRSLHKENHRVIGVDMDPANMLVGKRVADKVYHVPAANDPSYCEKLNDIISKENIELVFCSPDTEIKYVSKKRSDINAPLFTLPHKFVDIFLDKGRTVEFLQTHGWKSPDTMSLHNKDFNLNKAFTQFNAPLWLRASTGAGGKGSIIISSVEEGVAWLQYWKKENWDWVVQEFLPGRNFNWTGIIFEDKLITSGAIERLDYLMAGCAVSGITGNIRRGLTIYDERLNHIGETVCEQLTGSGIVSIDLREDKVGNPLITEINPRFAGRPWLYTGAEANFPATIVDLLQGRDIKLRKFNAPQEKIMEIRQVDVEPVIVHKDIVTAGFATRYQGKV